MVTGLFHPFPHGLVIVLGHPLVSGQVERIPGELVLDTAVGHRLQKVVRGLIGLVQVVTVLGRDNGQPLPVGDLHQHVDDVVVGQRVMLAVVVVDDVVVLQFHQGVWEHPGVHPDHPFRLQRVRTDQCLLRQAEVAPGGQDDVVGRLLGQCGQVVDGDPGEPGETGAGVAETDQLDQCLVPGVVPGQQPDVVPVRLLVVQ